MCRPGRRRISCSSFIFRRGATPRRWSSLRIFWRLTHTPPPAAGRYARDPAAGRRRSVHFLLYVATLVVQPISAGSAPRRIAPLIHGLSGCSSCRSIWPENRVLFGSDFLVHRNIGIFMAVLICATSAGALFHQFVRKDNLLARMWRYSAGAPTAPAFSGQPARSSRPIGHSAMPASLRCAQPNGMPMMVTKQHEWP